MAPEILVKSLRLKSACFEDLKKVDVWAFGMVMFNLLNPNLKYPFQLDLTRDSDSMDQVQELLMNNKSPTGSPKYKVQQETKWQEIDIIKKRCIEVIPAKRPTVLEIMNDFKALLCNDTGKTADKEEVKNETPSVIM